jgi:hypothetical protein
LRRWRRGPLRRRSHQRAELAAGQAQRLPTAGAERRADLRSALLARRAAGAGVTADAVIFTAAARRRITPPRSATASITSGMPWPRASRARNKISGPTTRPPSARQQHTQNGSAPAAAIGSSGSPRGGGRARRARPADPRRRAWKKRIRIRNTTAPTAPATPQAAAASTMKP